jgi:hypothetical protein
MAKSTFDSIAKFIGNNDKTLINQALNSMDFVNDVRVIRNASLNGTGMQKMTVAKGIRPLNLNVSARSENQRAYSGRKLLVYPGMKIISMIPEEYYNTFMSDMVVPGAKQVPFAMWVWEQEMAKLASEINDGIYLSDYKGNAAAYSAATVYNPGDYMYYGTFQDIYKCVTLTTAGQNPDTHAAKWALANDLVISSGWGTIIAAEITAGNIAGSNLVVTGALSSSNTMDKVELMVNNMTVAHRNLGGQILLSPVSYKKYIDQEKATFTAALDQRMGEGRKTVYGYPKWEIKQATWMGSSSRLIATQKNNLVFGTNVESDMTKAAKTIETLHGTDTVVKWVQGTEIADLETLYVNDQA